MSNQANEDPAKFIGNPINAFIMIKMLKKDLQTFVDSINNYNMINRKLLLKYFMRNMKNER